MTRSMIRMMVATMVLALVLVGCDQSASETNTSTETASNASPPDSPVSTTGTTDTTVDDGSGDSPSGVITPPVKTDAPVGDPPADWPSQDNGALLGSDWDAAIDRYGEVVVPTQKFDTPDALVEHVRSLLCRKDPQLGAFTRLCLAEDPWHLMWLAHMDLYHIPRNKLHNAMMNKWGAELEDGFVTRYLFPNERIDAPEQFGDRATAACFGGEKGEGTLYMVALDDGWVVSAFTWSDMYQDTFDHDKLPTLERTMAGYDTVIINALVQGINDGQVGSPAEARQLHALGTRTLMNRNLKRLQEVFEEGKNQ